MMNTIPIQENIQWIWEIILVKTKQIRGKMKSGSKKCHACGTMTQTPYKYTIVPAKTYGTIPVYNKAARETQSRRFNGR